MKSRAALLLLTLAAILPAQYSYFYTSNLSSPDPNWNVNGSFLYNGSYISNTWLTYGVEINTTANFSNATFQHYHRATPNAYYAPGGSYNTGSGLVVQLDRQAGVLSIIEFSGSSTTLLASTSVIPTSSNFRSLICNSYVYVYFGTTYVFSAAVSGSSGYGHVGIGRFNPYQGDNFTELKLGEIETTAPNPVAANSIATLNNPTSTEFTWTGALDDPNGIGVRAYRIRRNGVTIGEVHGAAFTDLSLAPSTTYTYTITTRDWHRNQSTETSFQITTPPASHKDPRRIGVHSDGSYYGAGGENIDTRSGNLNYTLPLVKTSGRNSLAVTVYLSYNSQIWRRDGNTVWSHGRDTGFGHGWRLLIASVTPVWSDFFTVNHYIYADGTGAQYRLDINTNGVWTSKEGFHGRYNAASNVMNFPDGSRWDFSVVSAGAEADAGTRYPGSIRDSNGNFLQLHYRAGAGVPWGYSSSRLSQVADVVATWGFFYNSSERLTTIQNTGNPSQGYTFTYSASQTLSSPFTPFASFGTATMLNQVRDGLNLAHNFQYGANNSGELTKVTLPYGGDLRWEYRDFTYSASRTLREVQTRQVTHSTGATPVSYTFARDDSGDASRSTHLWTTIDDATGGGRRKWTFDVNTASAYFGRPVKFEQFALPSATLMRQEDFTWTADATGRPYVASVLSTIDPGTAFAKQSKVEQTLDIHGNVTQRKLYDYPNLTTPARTYNYTYHYHITAPSYYVDYMTNRLLTASVSSGAQSFTLLTNTIDSYSGNPLISRPGAPGHDGQFSTTYYARGNVTRSVSGAVTIDTQ
ncbi:MAG: hypothetical protein FJW20_17235, partial [Acidimicrobiia bacterium]|nr:hypothetical protein [Acidimicrobiia bacterium]